MLGHTLQEVGSSVNHVRHECKQVLLSCGTSNDFVFTLGAAVVTLLLMFDFKSFCCYNI